MAREYIALPNEYLEEMATLNDEEYGRLIRGLQRYRVDGVEPDLKGNEVHFWKRVLNRDERYQEHFDEVIDKRRKAAEKRWKKDANAMQSNAKECICIDTNTNTNTYTNTNIDIYAATTKKIIDLWNTICTSFGKVREQNASRVGLVKSLLETYDINDVEKAFRKVQKSDFLKGKKGGWRASFDWCIKETNFTKIIDGNYDARAKDSFANFEQSEIDFAEDEARFFEGHRRKQ